MREFLEVAKQAAIKAGKILKIASTWYSVARLLVFSTWIVIGTDVFIPIPVPL